MRMPGVEIILAVGGTLAALTPLLRVIRDWAPARRQATAVALDAENCNQFRAHLRKLLYEQIGTGNLSLSPDVVDTLISDPRIDALDRLAARWLTAEKRGVLED
jgi:hypothetical protein